MATFIDEQSGTSWTPGSHPHFRLAAAWLPTQNVSVFQDEVRQLRRVLGVRSDFEFKFAKTHQRPDWRFRFYNLSIDLGLKFAACAFDKNRIVPGSYTSSQFYQAGATVLAADLCATNREAEAARCATMGKPMLLQEPIAVDDNKDARMLSAIGEAFRALRSGRDLRSALTIKPVFRDSAKDEALQLADMVMGAVGAHLDGDSEWCDLIRHGGRELGIVNWSSCPAAVMAGDLCENRTSRAT